jgi:competence ComEA-like helix-hairpin-helix protein
VLLVAAAGLIGWRWYSDHHRTRPTELQRDVAHRIDLNRATKSELMQIPGVGPQLAERIVSYRDNHGQFSRVEDLDAVHGIGGATLNKIRPWVLVNPTDAEPPPQTEPDRLTRKPSTAHVAKKDVSAGLVNVNTASLAELDTLPGIGPVLAQRIIAERAKRPFANVDDLRRVSGIGPKKLEAIRPLVTVSD